MSKCHFVTVSSRAPQAGDPAGKQIVDFNRYLTRDISLGNEGISRTPVGALFDGRIIYGHGIECLDYKEHFTFGTGRILVVHLADGSRERIRIARDVTVELRAETVSPYGK
jgi:hypothetical protein